MGYFPNGSSGDSYVHWFCRHCLHGQGESGPYGCPVQLAHLQHNYSEVGNKDSILHMLIPLDDKHDNGRCLMFIDRREVEKSMQSKIAAIRKEVRDSWNASEKAGFTDGYWILKGMADRIGHSRAIPENPSLAKDNGVDA